MIADLDLFGPREADEDLLTRVEASAYLARFRIHLLPGTLARLWSVGGDGPPCTHIRSKPFYARGALKTWAISQRQAPRRSSRDAADEATAR